ncbi:MAG: helix-turn-helix transcriptional regulator [Oscillospiraceae bacterium]
MEKNTLEEILGENIVKYRDLAGMTQGQLAECVGISPAAISRVERGLKMMKVRTLLATARALNVSCDALLCTDAPNAQLENIKCLLADQPSEYLAGVEKLIRTCVEEFEPKQKSPADLRYNYFNDIITSIEKGGIAYVT